MNKWQQATMMIEKLWLTLHIKLTLRFSVAGLSGNFSDIHPRVFSCWRVRAHQWQSCYFCQCTVVYLLVEVVKGSQESGLTQASELHCLFSCPVISNPANLTTSTHLNIHVHTIIDDICRYTSIHEFVYKGTCTFGFISWNKWNVNNTDILWNILVFWSNDLT